ncbi:hypothetical protein [Cytobacillus firmus]|uniref:Helix-turn-helix conjugative transposon-like domain-containing protein n=1 Tax=Cytobacillus firmus DS1 TaxID=1307436 RepID=W7L052_CYTFI|nr:hypothetical protein [Cytobacillus firmus]EWG08432.1 hypothetical protein PBF_24363 [Cytobacillus firmus DS1]
MEKYIDKKEILTKALLIMNPKIKKSLLSVDLNDRDDLEQEIKLKIVEAVLGGKIDFPPTFTDYYEVFTNKAIQQANNS